ncbi:hypothetical protein ACVIKO_002040 [Rhizobium ruizarguesonis]
MDAVVFLEPFRRHAHFLIEVAGRAKRTRRCRRTSGFFRFLPVANEMADELPTRPVRFLISFFSSGDHEILKSGTHPLGAGFPIEVDVASFKPKENRMANQGGTHEQHVKAGQQSHKNDSNARSASVGRDAQSSGTRGGSHEQHVKAGQQSHKNSH